MKMKWYGTATLLIESEASKILIDPYCRDFSQELPRLPLEDFKGIDAIFITHPHFDHFMDIDQITEVVKAPVYVGKRGLELAKKNGFAMKTMQEMKVGDHFQFGDILVKIHQGKHCVFDRGLIINKMWTAFGGKRFKAVRNLLQLNKKFQIGEKDIFTIELSQGEKKMVVMGSANIDEKEINPHHMDALVYPYQGRSDMCKYSIPIIDYLKPKRVILDHFDNAFPPLTCAMDCEGFARYVREHGLDYSITIPEYGKWIEI